MSKQKVVLLAYGKGGHTAQMKRFISNNPDDSIRYVALTNADNRFEQLVDTYYCIEARHKFSRIKNCFIGFVYVFYSLIQTLRILLKFKVTGFISTGPGLAVIPAIICKMNGIKVVYFESWSRFTKPSLAGRVMYKIAHLFFVQHKSLQEYYPNSKYLGRL